MARSLWYTEHVPERLSGIVAQQRRLLAVIVIILAVLGGGGYFFALNSTFFLHHPTLVALRNRFSPPQKNTAAISVPHRYEDTSKSIRMIQVTAVYFVPKDAVSIPEVIPVVEEAMEKIRRFHASQFAESSMLTYTVVPQPVRGERGSDYYDILEIPGLTAFEQTTEKLNRISDELERRGIVSTHDLTSVYPIEYIFFEGVGLGGGHHEGVCILVEGSVFCHAVWKAGAAFML